ncbi:hypothetical protein H8D29_06830 [PVC group bacterium]|nr:hypothetical protein [PVC group bacterium]
MIEKNEVGDIINELFQDGLVDIFTDEKGEFYFSLSDKGETRSKCDRRSRLNIFLTNIQTSLTTYCQGLKKIIGLLNEDGLASVDGVILSNDGSCLGE